MSELESEQFDILLRDLFRRIMETRPCFGVTAVQRTLRIGYNSGVRILEAGVNRGLLKQHEEPYHYITTFD